MDIRRGHPLPKRPWSLPIILSPEEVVHFLGCVDPGRHRLILTLLYVGWPSASAREAGANLR
jgi:hypothetical protein